MAEAQTSQFPPRLFLLQPTAEDVEWILREVSRKLTPDIKLRPEDVRAAWAGIRPLVRCVGQL